MVPRWHEVVTAPTRTECKAEHCPRTCPPRGPSAGTTPARLPVPSLPHPPAASPAPVLRARPRDSAPCPSRPEDHFVTGDTGDERRAGQSCPQRGGGGSRLAASQQIRLQERALPRSRSAQASPEFAFLLEWLSHSGTFPQSRCLSPTLGKAFAPQSRCT